MNIRSKNSKASIRGLTLVEIIGVLAIIAILASVLSPKVIQAIARSRVNSSAETYNTLRVAATDYFAKKGSFPERAGSDATDAATATGRFDADLLSGGFIDKLVSLPIGSQDLDSKAKLSGRVHVRSLASSSSGSVKVSSTDGGSNYNLDNDTSTADIGANAVVVSLVIPDLAVADAAELNLIIDGKEGSTSTYDFVGKCIYSEPSGGKVTAYLYLAHH